MKKCAPLSHARSRQPEEKRRRRRRRRDAFFFPFFFSSRVLCEREATNQFGPGLSFFISPQARHIYSSSSSSCLHKLKQMTTMEASDDDRSSHGLTCHTAPVRFSSLKKAQRSNALLVSFFFLFLDATISDGGAKIFPFARYLKTGRHLRVYGRIESALSNRLAQI